MSTVPQPHSSSNPTDLLDAALDYAARGWSIIPTKGKKAACPWKQYQKRPADERTLRRLFLRKDITGLAVILGSASGGLACRDYDTVNAYRHWASEHPALASTLPTVQTSRGFHVYHRGPEWYADLEDGEHRANDGHYCLLPPSVHPDGPIYTWRIPLPIGDLPFLDPLRAGFIPLDCHVSDFPFLERAALLVGTKTQGALLQRGGGIQDTQDTQFTHCMCERGKAPIADAIRATLPTAPGQRNRKVFALARHLKAIIADATPAQLKPIVRDWFDLALPVIRTKDFSESWEDFVIAWGNVKVPVGASIKAIAARASIDGDALAKLTSLCLELQGHHGPGEAWPLSCQIAGDIIGVSKERAARLLKVLRFEQVIKMVTPGGPKGSHRAAEYRFLGERT